MGRAMEAASCLASLAPAPDVTPHPEDPAGSLWHRGSCRVSAWVQMTSGASQALGDLLCSSSYEAGHGSVPKTWGWVFH